MTSNKIRLCDDPLIYSVDSPGVMIPFLGHGDESRERAVKISMICELFIKVYLIHLLLVSKFILIGTFSGH